MSRRSLVPLVRWCQRSVDLVRQQRGQGLVEYSMIIAFVAMAVFGAVAAFGTTLSMYYFDSIVGQLP